MALDDNLLALAPELNAEDVGRRAQFITWAALRVNRRVFCAKADLATVALAAHMLTRFSTASGAAPAGALAMEKVGDLQAGYSKLDMPGNEELATTSYGAMFAQMKRGLTVTPLVL